MRRRPRWRSLARTAQQLSARGNRPMQYETDPSLFCLRPGSRSVAVVLYEGFFALLRVRRVRPSSFTMAAMVALLLLLVLPPTALTLASPASSRSARRPNEPPVPLVADAPTAPPYYGPPRGDACSGLWPLPRNASCSFSDGLADHLDLSGSSFAFVAGSDAAKGSSLLHRAFDRYHGHIFKPLRPHAQIKATTPAPADGAAAAASASPRQGLSQLIVLVDSPNETLALRVDESYTLEVTTTVGVGAEAHLTAATVWGALRGLESFSQLTQRTVGVVDSVTINATYVRIADRPRFPWRGIMIDTSRHWLPVSTIHSMIDALSFNRMSVLHWHITDAQSFPLKTKTFPKLVEGAYGGSGSALHYDAADVKAIVAYAKDRGVRVVPEIDSPSHSDSWTIGAGGGKRLSVSRYSKTPPNIYQDRIGTNKGSV
jgi:hypothetical protein